MILAQPCTKLLRVLPVHIHDYAERLRAWLTFFRSFPSRAKTNPSPGLALLARVFSPRPLNLPDLLLQHLLRHQPLLRICIRAPRMNRVHAHVQDVPAAETA